MLEDIRYIRNLCEIVALALAALRQSGRTARLVAETFPLFLVVFDACLIFSLVIVVFFFISFSFSSVAS